MKILRPLLAPLRPAGRPASAGMAVLLLALGGARPAGAATEAVTVVDFTESTGKPYYCGLILGADGNFYGTTIDSATNVNGTIFHLTPAGVVTVLVNFTGNCGANPGSSPQANLLRASDGNFYGVTPYGGATGSGTVFKMTPAGVFTSLASFPGGSLPNIGASPFAALVEGTDGNFYGTTDGGGMGFGTVFKVTPAGVLTNLVMFTGTGGANPGESPDSSLLLGADGNFYGVTISGGPLDLGTIFKMTPDGVRTTVVGFTGTSGGFRGRYPAGPLIRGRDGNYYGTAGGGGPNFGTVFRLTPAGVFTTLVEFTGTGGANRGSGPPAALVQGIDGNFYGVTIRGGASDLGTVFRMTPAGGLTTLVEFTGIGTGPNRGSYPNAELVQAADGSLYGNTLQGGASDGGTVFYLRQVAAGSATQLVSVASEAGGTRVRWQAAVGQTSRVQYSTSLTSAWQNFTGTITANPGGVAEYLDTTSPRPAQRFYRMVTPP